MKKLKINTPHTKSEVEKETPLKSTTRKKSKVKKTNLDNDIQKLSIPNIDEEKHTRLSSMSDENDTGKRHGGSRPKGIKNKKNKFPNTKSTPDIREDKLPVIVANEQNPNIVNINLDDKIAQMDLQTGEIVSDNTQIPDFNTTDYYEDLFWNTIEDGLPESVQKWLQDNVPNWFTEFGKENVLKAFAKSYSEGMTPQIYYQRGQFDRFSADFIFWGMQAGFISDNIPETLQEAMEDYDDIYDELYEER